MGLFSKKTIVCERCGKEYQARFAMGEHICKECQEREEKKIMNVLGYVNYAEKMKKDSYSEAQLDEIARHRDSILEKYKMTNGITEEELKNATENYKKLTDAEAENILARVANSSIKTTNGAGYSGHFFVPTTFDNVVIDADDVFAVGYATTVLDDHEIMYCAVFTNDPYIPAFLMVYGGKLGFFEIMKNKKMHQGVNALYELMCPNMTYPVQDLKQLKQQIKGDGSVKGNINLEDMLDMISDAKSGSGIFSMKEYDLNEIILLPFSTQEMLGKYGYIEEDKINKLMGMDKMFTRNFWNKQIKRIANYDIGE